MPLLRIQFSAAAPNALWINSVTDSTFSLLNSSTSVDTIRRNSGRRPLLHSAESSPHTSLIRRKMVKMSKSRSSGMSSR